MNFRNGLPQPLFQADDGGGGGGSDGGSGGTEGFAAVGEAGATAEQGAKALEYLGKTEGFDAKAYEGKSHTEVWNAAREHHGKATADPFRGTPFEGVRVPEKFVVDKDGKKTVDIANLTKSYAELERGHFRRREEVRADVEKEWKEGLAKKAPATPGDYIPGDKMKFKGADGKERDGFGLKIGDRTVEVIPDDPTLNFIRAVAHKHGVDQAEFNQILSGYVEASLSSGPSWAAEAKVLGGEAIAEKRQARVDGFLKANLSQQNYSFFAGMPATARAIEAVEQLMTLSGHPSFVPEKGDVPGSAYNKDEIRTMMRDPRYTGQGRPGGADKAYVQQVRAAWKRVAN